MPFFSIIIPTYNRAHIIKRPIESVINQTYSDWELIIVDDGSTDDTKVIVDSYQDERIRYIWQENQERNAARSKGISVALAEWICFIDSDDEYYPNHLATFFEAIQEFPEYKIFYTETEFIAQNGSVKGKSNYAGNINKIGHPDSLWLASIHNTVFDEVQLPVHLVSSEDFYFMALAASIFEIKKLGIVTYRYHHEVSNNALTGVKYHVHLINKLRTFRELLAHKPERLIPFIKKKICVYSILLLYGHLKYNRGFIWKGLILNLKTFIQFPFSYIIVVLRMLYVKTYETLGLGNFKHRF